MSTFNDANNVLKLVRGVLVNTINATITQGTSLRVKDVSILADGNVVSDYNDEPPAVLLMADFFVRWRYR